MSTSTHLRRSSPSISKIPSIQRLTLGSLSSSSSPYSSSTTSSDLFQQPPFNTHHSSSSSSNHRYASYLRSLSGIVAGSALGVFLFSSSPSYPFSFADWSASRTALADHNSPENHAFHRPPLASPSANKRTRFLLPDEFRRRVFFNYEKRIRLYSPPEKVFEYFASHETPEGELLMTPADFMRAIIPVFPPSESNIIREGYLSGERRPTDLRCTDSELFMLFDTDNDGLISFAEYIFFVTLISHPESNFSVAFKMFDLDNNGEIEQDEFKEVMGLMRSLNRQGASHRDGLRIGLKVGSSVENGGLVEYFFGKDGSKPLQLEKFVKFLEDLRYEILRLEFAHYDYKSRETLSAKDFALSMVASANMNHINKFLNRVDELENDPNLRRIRITFDEFKAFAELRKKLHPLALAMFSYGKVKGLLTKDDFIRAASYVCGVTVTDNMVDIIFHVFDSNCDGHLSSDEFLRVLHRRENDIVCPKETGIIGVFSCWWNCSKSSSFVELLK